MGKKKNVVLPPQLPPDIEVEVSDEDLAFVKENREFVDFLSRLDTNLIDRHVTRVADCKEDELEALYEKKKKKADLKKAKEEQGLQVDRVDALPIKTLEGELCYRTVVESRPDAALKGNDSTSEVKDNNVDKGLVRLTKAERRQKMKKSKKEAKRKAKEQVKEDTSEGGLHSDVLAEVEKELSAEEVFARKKIKLAEVGMSLLEDPESNIKCLKELLVICSEKDHNIVKLGLMSLLAVFKDIIPGYRIRLPTAKELEVKVSKEVRQTRFYESTLLSSYKAYLLKLMALEEDPSFHCVAVRCMCILLDAVPHFNFRENLVAVVVRNLNSSDDALRKLCCETLQSLFTNEGKHGGQVTIEAVRLISELVKAHDCYLHPDIVEVFLSLKFDEDLGKARPKENVKVSRKKKRKMYLEQSNQLPSTEGKRRKHELMIKTREELNADMKSVSFTPDDDERRAAQSEILSAIFGTYFRIIRHCMDSSLSRSMLNDISSLRLGQHPLLSPCLTGLGKFSHLIDLDFMGALTGSLKKLAGHSGSHSGNTSNKLTVSEKLQCCIVAFRVMRNNLDALNVDLQEFYVQLYNLLLEYRPFRDRGDVLAEALKTMLWEGKQHDMHRAAAFVKRLATFSLSFGSPEALAALVTIKHLLLRNSKCRSLLENDPGGGSLSGLVVKYRPDASDPHLSGALASVLWELSLLPKHYNPSVSSAASSMLSSAGMNPSQSQAFLSTISPTKAFEDLATEQELFKAANKKFSPGRKIKRGNEFVIMNAEDVRMIESVVDEDVVEGKIEEHFKLLKDFDENERLRLELDRTSAAIRLYKEYQQQKKLKLKRKEG